MRLQGARSEQRAVTAAGSSGWLRRTLAVGAVLAVTSALIVADVFRSPELEWRAAVAAPSGLPVQPLAPPVTMPAEDLSPLPAQFVLPAPPLPPEAVVAPAAPIGFAPTVPDEAPMLAVSPARAARVSADGVPIYTDRDLARFSHAAAETETETVQPVVPALPPDPPRSPEDEAVAPEPEPPPDEGPGS